MLAVCIPVYNQKVERLVSDLVAQSHYLQEEVSIVIMDDASSEAFQGQYDNLRMYANIVQLKKNIGRSKIRNAFLQHTSAEYLLFLDCFVYLNLKQLLELVFRLSAAAGSQKPVTKYSCLSFVLIQMLKPENSSSNSSLD